MKPIEYEMSPEELTAINEVSEQTIRMVDKLPDYLIVPCLLRTAVEIHLQLKGIRKVTPETQKLFTNIYDNISTEIIERTNRFLTERN